MLGRPLASYLAHTTVAGSTERRTALLTVLGLLAVALCTIPFGDTRLGEPDALLPAITTAAMVVMLVSAAMLRAQYRTTRYVPLALLSLAFSVTAVLLLPYLLSFPHVFSPNGFGLGEQTTPWLWIAWHSAFVLLLGGYVWGESYFSRSTIPHDEALEFARRYTILVIASALIGTTAIFAYHYRLPVLVTGDGYTQLYRVLVDQLLLAAACIVLATLIARTSLRATTHLWLGVVLAAFALDVFLSGQFVSARYSVAWYVGFIAAAVWQTIFLVVQLQTAHRQLAALAASTESLQEEALRDPLTGLYNRRGFDERYALVQRDARQSGASMALLAIDIDFFKRYNDHYGHLCGDEALRFVAAAMIEVVNRPTDAVCRLGGDEFVVILGATDDRGANIVAERIRSRVGRLRLRNAPDVSVDMLSVSIGLAVGSAIAAETSGTLLERADQALYRAKKMGRNRVISGVEPRPEQRPDQNLRVV